ncbi:hypothetical protein F5B22DRAFT_633983 [Xylaria bambusicola]|uniref:uncharacterized protein n=1 Tax=Xylaria bambusicola TaxID=326684 RepID=UPI002007249C|nr:uncharacterized protein F5B22DRAFT_633983 [Xylaria bambusicola]KAI0523929.1 hypothetical protein F5B22DRAFT_633983 [Xylaria bambusicola]
MLLRPSGEGRSAVPQRAVFLALAVLLTTWLQLVDAQQQQQQVPQHRSVAQPPHLVNIVKDGTFEVDTSTPKQRGLPRLRQELPSVDQNRAAPKISSTRPKNHVRSPGSGSSMSTTKQNPNDIPYINDASALATLAPGNPVRAPNSSRHKPSILAGSGLSSLQSARSLENWEVQDYILLATIDGHLYAADRESGDERWHLQVEQPVVETIHYRPNTSSPHGKRDPDRHPLDDYVWAIEPTNDGAVYVWASSNYGTGLMSTGYTMKQLVDEMGHYASSDPPVVYTGHKKNTLITVDAATGRVLKWFGQAGSQVDQSPTCFPPNSRFPDSDTEECTNGGSITLSRTEYIVEIHHRDNGRDIATLRYAEWGPNSFDNDLRRQYHAPPDNRYFTSQHDGRVYAIAHPASTTSFALEFPVPVARVFDIAKPLDAPRGSNPELVLLPQPIYPVRNEDSAWARSHSVFLNQTEYGGWYAMSGRFYPLVVDAPNASINHRKSSEALFDDAYLSAALVGVHTLGDGINLPDWTSSMPPTLPSESYKETEVQDDAPRAPVSTIVNESVPRMRMFSTAISIPQHAVQWTHDLLTNPLGLILSIIAYVYLYNLLRGPLYSLWKRFWYKWRPAEPNKLNDNSNIEIEVEPTLPIPDAEKAHLVEPIHGKPDVNPGSQHAAAPPPIESEAILVASVDPEQETQPAEQESPEKKKKAHRGRRGGVKHRKGAKKQRDGADESPDNSPEEIGSLPGIENVATPPKPLPNTLTASIERQESTGPIINIGGIEVNQEMQLGMGSNGTIVFAGKFHGRDVAVKRMLTQFWDIATQETQLLLESDQHQNVIRYYAMSKNESFLYIALELCQASLSDVMERPAAFPQLARAGEMDLPRVLLQIANGLSFLHDLRIVHRDLKPQNILVTMDRDGRSRLLVSDFGLCKKLEGGQSSFGATTAHAAGTSGWRAPELLVDDDPREGSSMSMSSVHSDSSSQLVSADVMPNRRATRAIDIFSLGLVFFYVLTKGSHPFDRGGRFMREVNIRNGQFDLKPLDVLGDVAYEAKALIRAMLQADPRARPTARDVMAHPFFWTPKEQLAFLCDVSDHFELEPRDPPSEALATLESYAHQICRGDFLKALPREFVDSLGKQRKYTGTKFLDLLRALRNKRSHYGDLSDSLKKMVGPVPEGYLGFWTRRFPNLLIMCCSIIYTLHLQNLDTFQEYFKPRRPM